MQCKDIPDVPILKFLFMLQSNTNQVCATWFAYPDGKLFENSVQHAMPEGIPRKLALAKIRSLITRGLVDGCCCGCRGDFELTDKGFEALNKSLPNPFSPLHVDKISR